MTPDDPDTEEARGRYEQQLAEFLDPDLDEERLEADLARSRRRRRNGALVLALVVVVAGIAWLSVRGDDEPDSSGFVFEGETENLGTVAPRTLSVPALIDPRLVARLDLPVVVRSGNAEQFERIVTRPPARVLPAAPGDLVIGLARSGDEGRVVITGPAGWTENACIVASITTGLLPLDTVHWEGPGGCELVLPGLPAPETCRGNDTVVLAIDVPQDAVDLPTGGRGVAEALRVQLLHDVEGFDTASVRGQVDVSELAVDVPVLEGPRGAEAQFELGGAGARVTCVFA